MKQHNFSYIVIVVFPHAYCLQKQIENCSVECLKWLWPSGNCLPSLWHFGCSAAQIPCTFVYSLHHLPLPATLTVYCVVKHKYTHIKKVLKFCSCIHKQLAPGFVMLYAFAAFNALQVSSHDDGEPYEHVVWQNMFIYGYIMSLVWNYNRQIRSVL